MADIPVIGATFAEYFANATSLNETELVLRENLLPQIPDVIFDAHTHASHQSFADAYNMPPHIKSHIMSTFPQVDIAQSQMLDNLLMPGKLVRKLRFAHVYPGFDQRAITDYIASNAPDGDGVALFGLADDVDELEYTISELELGHYSALKMYYLTSTPPKSKIYEYFPEEILAVAERRDVPIILHLPRSLYSSADEAAEVASRFPRLKIVLAHVGVANVPKRELSFILRSLARYPNLYVDTAMVDSVEIVEAALRSFGPKRVLYGSDEPLNLLRIRTFFNSDLGTDRVLTDYPYHWVDVREQQRWRHILNESGPLVHSHWRQLGVIIEAIRAMKLGSAREDKCFERVFSVNALSVFPTF